VAGALHDLIRDPNRRSALATAALAGAGRFDVAARVGEMVDLYRELLAERR
jgi:hypothetical protein